MGSAHLPPSEEPPRWRPEAWYLVLGAALLLAVLNGVWLLIDRTSPSFDQASYLRVAVLYDRTVADHGIDALYDSVHTLDPGRGPAYPLALMPFLAVFGHGPRSALLYNAGLAVLMLLCAGEVAKQAFGTVRARYVAMLLVALTPLLVGLQHEVLVDFQLTTCACAAIAFLLRSDGFMRLPATLLAALAMGLGTLTKVTFPAFVIGPVLVVLGLLVVRTVRRRAGSGRAWLHVAGGLVLVVAVALPWYLDNREATTAYVRSTTGGPLSVGAGPAHPLTLHNVTTFVLGLVDAAFSAVLVAAALVAMVALLVQRLARREVDGRPARLGDADTVGVVAVASWFVVPFCFLVSGHNQDMRLLAPGVAGFVILVSGALSAVRPRPLGTALVGVVVLVLGFQALNRTAPVAPDWLPDQLSLQVRGHTLYQAIGSSSAMAYQRLPARDRATPIYRYLEQQATVEGVVTQRTVCILEAHPVVNTNTFGYLVAANDDPFDLLEVRLDPGLPSLKDQLRSCDYALYIKPPAGSATAEDRISLVNQPFGASHMTPRLFALFPGPERSFPVGARPVSDDPDADPAPDLTRVRVLARQ